MNLKNLEYIEKNNPVTKEEIDFAEKRINGELPKVYKEFLRYEFVCIIRYTKDC